MTTFVDASALVAIIRQEPEAEVLRTALDNEQGLRLTSGIAIWEAAMALARSRQNDLDYGYAEVERYCALVNIIVVPIGSPEAAEAIRAHARYGKGTGHSARLNMGDCFAYACARTNDARLLYKGDDFARTDVAL